MGGDRSNDTLQLTARRDLGVCHCRRPRVQRDRLHHRARGRNRHARLNLEGTPTRAAVDALRQAIAEGRTTLPCVGLHVA
jgi:hypothetical protein